MRITSVWTARARPKESLQLWWRKSLARKAWSCCRPACAAVAVAFRPYRRSQLPLGHGHPQRRILPRQQPHQPINSSKMSLSRAVSTSSERDPKLLQNTVSVHNLVFVSFPRTCEPVRGLQERVNLDFRKDGGLTANGTMWGEKHNKS